MTRCDRPYRSDLCRGQPAGWILILLIGLHLPVGCSNVSSNEKRLPDSTFTRVLTELHLAKVRHTLETPPLPNLRDSIFAHYGVDSTAFNATLRYYSRRPSAFESRYQSVIDTLQALRPPRRGRNPSETIPDSLREQHERRDAQ